MTTLETGAAVRPVQATDAGEAAERRAEPRALPWGRLLVAGWIAFTVSFAFAPAGNPSVSVPAWADALGALFLALPVVAVVLALVGSRTAAFGLSLLAASAGTALSYACFATDHHLGILWPAYELAGSVTLAWLSLNGLRAARRRQ